MKWLTVLFGIFILLIIVLADAGRLGVFAAIYRFPSGDKVGHFLLYGVLALLIEFTLFRSFPRRNRKRLAIGSSLLLALMIGIEEFSQQLFASRTFSLADLGASYAGVACFACLALKYMDLTSPDASGTDIASQMTLYFGSTRDAGPPVTGRRPAPQHWIYSPLPRAAPVNVWGR